ncbi:hypothetical protein AAY473_015295, partial [Plecturocebus cupreus]
MGPAEPVPVRPAHSALGSAALSAGKRATPAKRVVPATRVASPPGISRSAGNKNSSENVGAHSGSYMQYIWSSHSLAQSQHLCQHLELPVLPQQPECLAVQRSLSPRLECSRTITAHCSFDVPMFQWSSHLHFPSSWDYRNTKLQKNHSIIVNMAYMQKE